MLSAMHASIPQDINLLFYKIVNVMTYDRNPETTPLNEFGDIEMWNAIFIGKNICKLKRPFGLKAPIKGDFVWKLVGKRNN